ncbi:3-oxoacyl-ACP reductase [Xanthomonas phaseoli pv. phaseoli]|uniref:3-oxoacyl-ACP reductase n=1 Tax=Xanthomonas campestris pv. phaseoli TaxID=317013 RepID=A0AB34QH02_XANCH|nr:MULTISPECIES: SDR family oxidoreductase [Xanthomonas]MBV6815046.1 SDR family oxidoreductase [Xanthomonas campestris pv. passiflorae]ATS21274.1 SDR family oxidoreductase [Xanthomonas phaseoli pv. phaseoli]ATS27947.1 SDR family oxidoreductase [Xanthomonas phaseoli pv. phaseoli]ATS36185.1 SDR family oxidoreductase [Xanthomonas phaseoli pv. phaseoli]AZU13132.1 3-oxoacyl-ACP reductase [Xanthomonas phaseoli pv. phaseoli]
MNDSLSFNPFSLADKRILVSGASSGLGRAIALGCARMGGELIVSGRDPRRLDATLADLRAISERPHQALRADLTVATERASLVAALSAPLHGVVHSAGISRLCPARMVGEAHLREVQATNVDAPILLTQGLLKRNLIAADGAIVFIASIAAHIGVAGVGAYSASKAALIAYARCLAMEVVKRHIRVNCLSPALVDTPLLDATAQVVGSLETERSNYPLGFGRPDDVANAAIFLLSGASRWITGTSLVMDGGLTIS